MASIHPSFTTPETHGRRRLDGAGGLVWGLTSVAWGYLVVMAWGMANMSVSADWGLMPAMTAWGPVDLALVCLMWTLMMAAMMLPSVAPLVRVLRRIDAARVPAGPYWMSTLRFVSGYLAVWTVFSVVATLVQWGLLERGLISPMMESASRPFSAALLFVAGVYQLSPFKHACLHVCRSALGIVLTQSIDDRFALGWQQGLYCAGCCWVLMALLFVFGVMNLLWVLALSAIVFFEKCLRHPRGFSCVTGLAFIVLATMMLSGVWPGPV